MANLAGNTRSKTIETRTVEEIPVQEEGSKGLGKPWQEFLRDLNPDEREITKVYIYRADPPTQRGYLTVSEPAEAVDEEWIRQRFGGGTFKVKIQCKDGRSGYDPNVIIVGAPKFGVAEPVPPGYSPAAASTPAANSSADNGKLIDLLERVVMRLEDRASGPSASPLDTDLDRLTKLAAVLGIQGRGNQGDDIERLSKMVELLGLKKSGNDFDGDLARLEKLANIVADRTHGATAAAGKPILEQLQEVMQISELLGLRRGEGKTGLADIATMLIEKSPEIAQRLTQFASTIAAARASHPAPPPAGPVRPAQILAAPLAPGGPAGAPPDLAGAPDVFAPVQTSATAPLRMSPMGAPAPAPPQEEGPIDPTIEQRLVELVAQDWDGGAIVDWLLGCRQEAFVQQLGQFDAATITHFLSARPVLGPATRLPQWNRILDEAKTYIRENVQGEIDARDGGDVTSKPN